MMNGTCLCVNRGEQTIEDVHAIMYVEVSRVFQSQSKVTNFTYSSRPSFDKL